MRRAYQPTRALRLGVVALVAVLAGGVVLGVVRMRPGSAGAAPAPAYSVPGETSDQVHAFLDQQFPVFVAGSQGLAPKPLLPATERDIIQRDMSSVASCMQGEGIGDFPEASASYGDGSANAPVIAGAPGTDLDPQSPAWQSAVSACSSQFAQLHVDGLGAAGSAGSSRGR